MGVAIAAVAGQSPESAAAYLAANPLNFPLLIDPDRNVIKAYGVYHLIGLDAINMARPSSFLIDGGQTVRFLYVGETQFDRPAPEVLLAEAAKLRS